MSLQHKVWWFSMSSLSLLKNAGCSETVNDLSGVR